MILKNKIQFFLRLKIYRNIPVTFIFVFLSAVFLTTFSVSSCKVYKFSDVGSILDSIKTVKVNFFENRARYINPQLSPKLTDKLRQKIVGQTKLSQTNNEDADWEISGTITDYSFSTSVISGQQGNTNRLNVTVHLSKYDRVYEKKEEYDVSRSFEINGSQSFQTAESAKIEEIIRTMTDEIFNKLFSNW